jgi:LmbE family N-acetylglucosaminyl deacetylase
MRNFGAGAGSGEISFGLPEHAERVLVLSPHPDDESIGCGGTLSQLAARGSAVDVVFMTGGAPPGDAALEAQRKEEARDAAHVLRLRDVRFLGGQDGGLHLQPQLSAPLEQLIEDNDYRVIFCPWPGDDHSDHQATFAILRDALLASHRAGIALWFYEVWSPLPANRMVNIDLSMQIKTKAIGSHLSQMRQKDYVRLARGLAKIRAQSCGAPHTQYAEAFYVCDASELTDLEKSLQAPAP